MPNKEERSSQMLAKLKAKGCRITPQRLAIIDILAGSKIHPSVEQIYAQMKPSFPATSLATVYKTVALLKELEELLELAFGPGSSHYDGYRPFSHPHIFCTQCKKITDIDCAQLTQYPEKLQDKTGFKIYKYQMNFLGICPKCQSDRNL